MKIFMENTYENLIPSNIQIGSLREYSAKGVSLKNILEELNLSGKYFVVLVNGKRMDENYITKENDKILILPKIAGGSGLERII